MHVAVFTDFHESSMGGVQASVRAQRRGLEDFGYRVTIFSPPPAGAAPADPATVCVPAVPFFRPNGFPMVAPSGRNRRLIEDQLDRRAPVDVIHAQTNLGIGILAVQIARGRSLPLVQTMHGRDDVFAQLTYPVPYLTTTILRLLHRRYVPHRSRVLRLDDNGCAHNAWRVMVNHANAADRIVIPSHHFAARFRNRGVSTPIEVISNGLVGSPALAGPPAHGRKPSDPLRVMWCGRLSPEKRPIEAILAAGGVDGCRLDIYGEGPWAGRLKKFISAQGLSDRVRLKGRVSQDGVLAAMREHDVLLYSSHGFDNQPMVLLEAVAAGLPVVYCDPDLAECVPPDGALRADGPSAGELTGALRRLRDDPSLCRRMSDALRAAGDDVQQTRHSRRMARLYEELVAGRTTHQAQRDPAEDDGKSA
ncbi:MAG TPA: glycosyltransferase [Actinoplanes sp.]|nr:glycosyltransferase [Actinoplanes sp.]